MPRPRRAPAGPVAIELDRLSKRSGPVTAVDDLTFTVRPGTVTGFLGPSGAGKTNLGLGHFFAAVVGARR